MINLGSKSTGKHVFALRELWFLLFWGQFTRGLIKIWGSKIGGSKVKNRDPLRAGLAIELAEFSPHLFFGVSCFWRGVPVVDPIVRGV